MNISAIVDKDLRLTQIQDRMIAKYSRSVSGEIQSEMMSVM